MNKQAEITDAILETEAEAWKLRHEEHWEKITGRSSDETANILIRETGKIVSVPGPNCCVFCGEVFVPADYNSLACGWCGAI